MDGEQTFEIRRQRGRQGKEADGLGSGCTVDDDGIPAAGRMLGQNPQGQQLVETGDDGHLLGPDSIGSSPFQQRPQIFAHRRPGRIEELLGIDLLGGQVVGDLFGVSTNLLSDGISERMGGVCRQYERAATEIGHSQRSRRRDRGLAGSTFSCHEEYSHKRPP